MRLKISHKLRLACTAAGASGLILGISLFGGVVYAQQLEVSNAKAELTHASRLVTESSDVFHEIEDLHHSQPTVIAAVFETSDMLPAPGSNPLLRPIPGFEWSGNILQIGEVKDRSLVVVGLNFQPISNRLKLLSIFAFAAWAMLTPAVGIITWITAHLVFRPLGRLAQQAEAIGGSDYSQRLDASDSAEIGEFAEQLNRMLDRIERTIRREEQFASDAAHELRTPLAIMRTRIETIGLTRRTLEEYQQSNAKMLVEIERMTRLVESLLRTARAESRVVVPIEISPVVEATVLRWQSEGHANVKFSGVTARVAIADDEIEIVLDNLVSNAVRFSPRTEVIEVSVAVRERTVQVSVRDRGPGIAPEIASTLFDRFVRADTSRNRGSGGAGIGLSVCRRIVEMRGGTIYVEPTEETGTKFVCEFPRID